MPSTSIIDELRQRIKDTRYNLRAFAMTVTDPNALSAVAEITNDRLIVTVGGGSATSIDFDLTFERYDTVGKLYGIVHRIAGYAAQFDEDGENDHPSIDLLPFGPVDIRQNAVELRHRLFSDTELEIILTQAIQRHNPSFDIVTLPPQEHVFVLTLAQGIVARQQASDAAKRRGLDSTVSDLLQIANSFEQTYASDAARLKRAIVSPKEASSNTMGQGDIVLGQSFRMSSRTGYQSPLAQAMEPSSPVLYDPDPMRDAEDDNASIRWIRNKDTGFFDYEIWMDTQPEITRASGGNLPQYYPNPPSGPYNSDYNSATGSYFGVHQSTSKRVFRSFGPNGTPNNFNFSAFVQELGQGISSCRIGQLEPSTDYYFQLYITSLNYLNNSSNVVKVTTKALRTRFANPAYLSTAVAGAGTVVTVSFDPTKGPLVSSLLNAPLGGFIFRIGGKVVTLTYIDQFDASFVVPQFQFLGMKDLSIQSPTGLVDVKQGQFNVTS